MVKDKKMIITVALKRIAAKKSWSLITVLLIALTVTTFNTVVPLVSATSKWVEFYGENIASYILVDSGSKTAYVPIELENVSSSFFNESEINKIKSINGVSNVYRMITSYNYWFLNSTEENKVIPLLHIPHNFSYSKTEGIFIVVDLVGIDFDVLKNSSLPIPFALVEGKYPNNSESLILADEFLKSVGYQVGSNFTLYERQHNNSFKISGFVRTIPLISLTKPFILIDYEQFFRLHEKIYNMKLQKLSTYVFVKLSRPDPQLAEQVENEIYKTFSYRQRLYVFYFKDLLARTASLVNVSLFVYKVAAIVVILLLIGSVVTISFLDLVKNRNEFGLLMTMGWNDKEITSYAFYHLLVLSSLGLIIGTTSTILAGNLIVERIMSSNSNLSVVMLYFPLNIPETFYVFASIVLVVVSTILSSLLLYLYLRRLTPSMLLESD